MIFMISPSGFIVPGFPVLALLLRQQRKPAYAYRNTEATCAIRFRDGFNRCLYIPDDVGDGDDVISGGNDGFRSNLFDQ
jgi:hypothetical protein